MYVNIHIHNGILFIFSLKKQGNPDICNNIDETGGHYAKWKKQERKRQILHGVTYMWNLKNKSQAGSWGKQGEVDKMVQTFSYKIKSYEDLMYNRDYRWQYCIV